MQKAFDGADRFFPITYQKDWAVVREVAEGSGVEVQQAGVREGIGARGRAKKAEAEEEIAVHEQAQRRECRTRSIRASSRSTSPASRCCADIDLDSRPRHHRVIGPSGTGKSTLIRCINRLVEPTVGQILFEGWTSPGCEAQALRHARRRIGMVFQEYNLVERLTVMENVLSGRLATSAVEAWLRNFRRADIARRSTCSTRRARGFRAPARRRLSGRPAPARRHRARA